MFEQSILAPPDKAREAWSTAASLSGQFVLISLAVLIPLIRPDAMPRALLSETLRAPAPPHPARPLKDLAVAVVSTRIESAIVKGRIFEPASIPKEIKMIDDGGAAPRVEGDGVPGAIPGAVYSSADSVGRLVPEVAPPPPPVAQPASPPERKTIERIKVGGQVQEALIVRRVMPIYPVLAKQAHIQGTVRLTGVIATDGTIRQLQVVSGHPMLIAAALEAVRQWIYRPTLLNGDPVEVVAPIDVNFKLAQ